MSIGSLAPPGCAYVIRRPTAPGKTDGPPVYLTRRGMEIQIGSFTDNLANARRWKDRSATFGYLKRNRAKKGQAGKLDHLWHSHRVQDRPPPGRTSS